ncbi:MAG: L-threonine 3-dehydrogenase [Parachlamydiales bacterium]
MRALVKRENAPGLWLEEVARPKIADNEVLIKVRKAAICGTDVHIYKWDEWAQSTTPLGVTVGHEFMGEVVERGRFVYNVEVGQRVSVEGHLFCGVCRNCREDKRHLCTEMVALGRNYNGGFADYVKVRSRYAFAIPDEISDDYAALCDPLGNAIFTTLSCDVAGEDVLITGAGPIGCMAAAVCKMVGACRVVVTDINDKRLALAKRMGATYTLNPHKVELKDELDRLGFKNGFTVALEMSGSMQAFANILDLTTPGAEVALLGILPSNGAIDWPKMIFKGITLKGIYGRKVFSTWYKMIHLLQNGLDLTPIITHRFPLEEYKTAFETMIAGDSGKIILEVA